MTPSLEGWPTKAKEAPSPHEVRLAPLDTNPVFQSLSDKKGRGEVRTMKAYAYYFTVLIYLATWRAAQLGIFTHFTFINLPRCRQSINSLMDVYYTDPQLLFMCAWSQSWSHFFVLTPPKKSFCITPCLQFSNLLQLLNNQLCQDSV